MLLAQMHLAGDVAFGSTVKSLLPPSLQSLSSCPWSENVTLWHLATHTSGLPCNASRFYRNNGFRNRSITEYTPRKDGNRRGILLELAVIRFH